MKRIIAIALFTIAGFTGAGRALAQDHAVQATIPFEFTAGDKVLPAGTYTIGTESTNLIVISNRDKSAVVVTAVLPDPRESKKGELVFDKYGDRYFLSEIRCRSNDMSLQLPPSKAEKQTRREEAMVHSASQVFVAAR